MDNNIVYVMLAVVVILSAVNLFFVTSKTQSITAAVINAAEDARPANIEIIKLSSDCQNCFDIDNILTQLKGKNIKVTKEESVSFSSDRGKELISRLGITKLPTLVVSGEVNKPTIESIWKSGWELKTTDKDYYVYKDILPPYSDPTSGSVIGLVTVTHLVDSTCTECTSLSSAIDFLKQSGVFISEEKTIDYRAPESKELISRFDVQKLPSLIISKNVLEYPTVAEIWRRVGAVEKDDFFVLHAQQPPYKDVKSGEVKGLVKVVYLTDSSCTTCYDVSINKDILEQSYGVFVSDEDLVDVNSTAGKDLIKKYNIQKAPIILVAPEAFEYSRLVGVWPQVGSREADGWFVMRNPEVMGAYRDLVTGNIVPKS